MALEIGPLLGAMTANSVKVWIKGKAQETASRGRLRLLDKTGAEIATKTCQLKPEADFTGCVTFAGLSPDTAYSVVAAAAPELDEIQDARFRTAPDASSPRYRKLRFGAGSCRWFGWNRDTTDLKESDKIFAQITQIHAHDPLDFFLMTGDQIYADVMFHRSARSVKDFFTAYRRGFGTPNMQRLFRRIPTYMILDDHEIRNDWSRDELRGKEQLFRNAMIAYRCYQDSHNPDHGRRGDVLDTDWWYSFQHGAFPFFVTDARTQRRKKPAGQRTMLGARQLRALKTWLKANKDAPRLFVVCSIPLFPDTRDDAPFDDPMDKWAGFNAERFEILDLIRKEQIEGVIFVGGDVHNSHFGKLHCDQDPNFEVTSLVSSALFRYSYLKKKHFHVDYTLPNPTPGQARNSYRYTTEGYQHLPNFAIFDVDLSGPGAGRCTAEIFSLSGRKLYGPYVF